MTEHGATLSSPHPATGEGPVQSRSAGSARSLAVHGGKHLPLLLEDRPEFERALDEALSTAHRRPDLAAGGPRLNTEQLRTMALSAASAIAACAATEYERFVRLRDEARRSVPDTDSLTVGGSSQDAAEPDSGGGLTGAMGRGLADATGAGLVALVSVLAPVLFGTAAVIFLLLGYLLHIMTPEPAVAAPMRSVGWLLALLALAGIVISTIGFVFTALRNGADSLRAPHGSSSGTAGVDGPAAEVAAARAEWREALVERGIVPFLREALRDPAADTPPPADAPESAGEQRPSWVSPDLTSPDYGGPGQQPE